MNNAKSVSLLIVDDEQSILSCLATLFEDAYNCVTAGSVEEALDRLSETRFDLVLTDINMPGYNGIELCEILRADYPEAVAVVMSAYHDVDSINAAMDQGAVDYITKPFDLSDVARVIQTALTPRALRREAS